LGWLERLKLQMKQAWRLYPLKNDIILPPSPRYDRFAYFEERQRKKQQAAERRRMPYQPKRERPIVQQIREGLEREFAWAITKRKEQEQYWLQKLDPDNSLKRCLAPHLSTRNMRTEEIEQQITAMSEAEWQQLLELVPLTTLKEYQRIRRELLAKHRGTDLNES
jgi:predicted  nucleic acid-binding Zn-ribbon protein